MAAPGTAKYAAVLTGTVLCNHIMPCRSKQVQDYTNMLNIV